MSPINTLSVLALASTVFAVPHYGEHGHGHSALHHRPSGAPGAPWGAVNGTGSYGAGTGLATGSTSAPTTLAANYAPTPVGPATANSATGSAGSSASDASAASASDSTCSSSTVTVKTKVYTTVTVPASGVAPVPASSGLTKSTTTVTSTVHVTRTLTLPASASGSATVSSNSTGASSVPKYGSISLTYTTPSGASSTAAPVQSSAASSYVPVSSAAPTYSAPAETTTTFSSEALPVESSAPAYSAPYSAPASSSSVYVAPTTTSSIEAAPVTTSTSSSAAATSSSAPSHGSSGKRGVAYEDASLTECFLNKPEVSWGYNWVSKPNGLNSGFKYIPTLHNAESMWTDSWSTDAKAAISSGSTHLFAFNEPDMSSQANLTPEQAAAAYKTHMQPFAGQAKLCAPSVTNGGGAMGLDWLVAFMAACDGCTIDCVNVHWYDSAQHTEYFKSHVQNATDISGGKPVFVTEFGASGSDADVGTFLGDVMPWMDSQSWLEGYSYFMVKEGMLVSGGEPSSYGSVYAA
ncbi:hypothetical protein B0A48_10713 [Cryoendolithus antarcticus]|uniref:Asl1-like glycosyl hydrolase catalytic domain-containing protein n=1 Tax=Cryoendolithus antarcticus TaxID=1507870 RepID=A0A1V8SYB2_9PEZI|nr:hypothetical protein B0A48_10713 [Cryoendolithus antarcticus]